MGVTVGLTAEMLDPRMEPPGELFTGQPAPAEPVRVVAAEPPAHQGQQRGGRLAADPGDQGSIVETPADLADHPVVVAGEPLQHAR